MNRGIGRGLNLLFTPVPSAGLRLPPLMSEESKLDTEEPVEGECVERYDGEEMMEERREVSEILCVSIVLLLSSNA